MGVGKFFAHLPNKQKRCFILRGITDLAYENTAKEYKKNEEWVMMILTNKLIKIIDKLKEEND